CLFKAFSQRLGLPREGCRSIDVSEFRGQCRSGTPRRVDVGLDFTKGDRSLGRRAIRVEDSVVRVLPALVNETIDRLPGVFDEAVTVSVAVLVYPSKCRLHVGPDGFDESPVASPLKISPR